MELHTNGNYRKKRKLYTDQRKGVHEKTTVSLRFLSIYCERSCCFSRRFSSCSCSITWCNCRVSRSNFTRSSTDVRVSSTMSSSFWFSWSLRWSRSVCNFLLELVGWEESMDFFGILDFDVQGRLEGWLIIALDDSWVDEWDCNALGTENFKLEKGLLNRLAKLFFEECFSILRIVTGWSISERGREAVTKQMRTSSMSSHRSLLTRFFFGLKKNIISWSLISLDFLHGSIGFQHVDTRRSRVSRSAPIVSHRYSRRWVIGLVRCFSFHERGRTTFMMIVFQLTVET